MRRRTPSSPGEAPELPIRISIDIYMWCVSFYNCLFQHHFQAWSDQHAREIHIQAVRWLSFLVSSERKHFLCHFVLFQSPLRERIFQLWCAGICNSLNNSISELYLDFAHQDFTTDLIRFFKSYPGSNLKVLEVRGMDDPMDLDVVSSECPNLVRLKMMLSGVFIENKLFWMYFSKLSRYSRLPIQSLPLSSQVPHQDQQCRHSAFIHEVQHQCDGT